MFNFVHVFLFFSVNACCYNDNVSDVIILFLIGMMLRYF